MYREVSWHGVPFFLSSTSDLERYNAWSCHLHTSNSQINAWVSRAVSDLHMMTTELATGPYPYAGLPWFNTPFGRDGIMTALECLWLRPGLARGALAYLASTQATEVIPEQDAEPGNILHETRKGEMAMRMQTYMQAHAIPGPWPACERIRRPVTLRAPLQQLNAYLGSTLAVVLAGLLAKLIESVLPLPNLSIVFLTAVLCSAVTWGLWPAIVAAILSMLVYDFGFVQPLSTFTVPSPQALLALSIFLLVAVLTSHLTARVRDQAETATRREARTARPLRAQS